MNPELAKKMLDVIAAQDDKAALALLIELAASMAAGGAPPAEGGEALAETPEADPPAPGEEDKALAALTSRLDARDAQYKALSKRLDEQDAASAVLELDERRVLVGELVKLGVEFPATAWEGEPDKRKPVKRLSAEPIAELRDRVAALRKLKPAEDGVSPPASGAGVVTLSKVEQAYCTKNNLTPEQFAAKKAGSVRKAK